MGPGDLNKAVCGLPVRQDPNVIVGLDSPDDAGVYRLSEDLAIIQTVDFITPIVDDPFTFGQIAAANSLSDVYAMGGQPVTAMNVACFPKKTMDISVLRSVLLGGLDRMNEAGVALLGGHTVEDPELKYGLSVTGTINPKSILTKGGAIPGDMLVLTKPLGTGIVSTASKAGASVADAMAAAISSMTALNSVASRLARELGAHACTDITGFGLLGHAAEMMELSGVGMQVEWNTVPFLPRVEELVRAGFIPGGTGRNKEYRAAQVSFLAGADYAPDVLFDPQTSGGLLIAIPQKSAEHLVERLHGEGVAAAAIIGAVLTEPRNLITVS